MSGVAVTTVAIWTIGWKHQFVTLLDTKFYIIISYVLLSAGLLSIATVFLGCYGIRSDKKSAICLVSWLYVVIICLVFGEIFPVYIVCTQEMLILEFIFLDSSFLFRQTGLERSICVVCLATDCYICFRVFGGQRYVCVRNANRRWIIAIDEYNFCHQLWHRCRAYKCHRCNATEGKLCPSYAHWIASWSIQAISFYGKLSVLRINFRNFKNNHRFSIMYVCSTNAAELNDSKIGGIAFGCSRLSQMCYGRS